MKKLIALSLFVFFANELVAQTGDSNKPLIVSLVTKDSVFVKWVPRNFEMMKAMLTEGVSVSTIFSGTENDAPNTPVTIGPLQNRWTNWNLTDPSIDKAKTLLEGVLETKVSDTTASQYAFAMTSIEASVSEKMNVLGGFMLGFKKESTNFFTVSVSVKGFQAEKVSIDLRKITKNANMPALTGKLDKKRIATIEWDAKSINKEYLGFVIERKVDNGKYAAVSQLPYVHLVTNSEKKDKLAEYRDEQVEQGKKYTYRVTGINYFGRKGSVSNEVELLLPKLVNATVAIDTIFADKNTRELKVHLSPEDPKTLVQAVRIQLLKSKELLKDYTVVYEQKLTGKDTVFNLKTTSELMTGDANYYKVLVFSPDNDTISSPPKYFFTLDQEPPKAVQNLIGKIDSAGIVTLTWEQTTDKDLQGFRVFRANSKKEEFVERNQDFIKPSLFNDTLPLNTLTNEIYYFVIAVDENFNNSPISDTVLILKPDTIPPTAPVLEDIISRNAQVKLTWEQSVSEDVFYQALFRIMDGKTDTLLSVKNFSANQYIDSTIAFGKDISYQLIAKDRSGNIALSKQKGTFVEPGYRPALENVMGKVDRTNKQIEITWNKPSDPVFQYFIYRKKNDGKFELIETQKSEKGLLYLDRNLTISSKYEYMVQYQTIDGFRSLKHQSVQLKY